MARPEIVLQFDFVAVLVDCESNYATNLGYEPLVANSMACQHAMCYPSVNSDLVGSKRQKGIEIHWVTCSEYYSF
jgi:hypothetical protein